MTDAAAIGSAICAGVATGLFEDQKAGVAVMVKPRDVYNPNTENNKMYNRLISDVYRTASESFDGPLEKLGRIVDE